MDSVINLIVFGFSLLVGYTPLFIGPCQKQAHSFTLSLLFSANESLFVFGLLFAVLFGRIRVHYSDRIE